MFRIARSALLACALLGGTELAAEPGDFGRPRENILVDELLPWIKDEVDWLTGQPGSAPYTDDERALRNLAYAILLPPQLEGPSRFAVLGVDFVELQRWLLETRPFDVRSYGDDLIARPYRSSTARYARLIDDIRADTDRVPPFFSMANRVFAADAVRTKSLQFVSRLAGDKYELALARIAENRTLVDRVYDHFRQRIASYRYALECLIVLTPSPNAVEAERALFVLEDRLKRMTSPAPVAAGGLISK